MKVKDRRTKRTTGSRDSRPTQAAATGKFVIEGTVKKLRASNLREEPATVRTVLVQVNRVVRGTDAMSGIAGREITVRLAPKERVTVGERYLFHTAGWVFGENIGVQSLGHESAAPSRAAALAQHPDDPVRSLRAHEALTQAETADLIVSGRVSAIRVPPSAVSATAAAGRMRAAPPRTRRISEHDPQWQEAVIDVDDVHKGQHRGSQVVVRFPASTDVRWHKAPKFRAGQQGLFLLHKEQPIAAPVGARARALVAAAPGQYTALHPADVQPLEELPRIQLAARQSATVSRRPARSRPRRNK